MAFRSCSLRKSSCGLSILNASSMAFPGYTLPSARQTIHLNYNVKERGEIAVQEVSGVGQGRILPYIAPPPGFVSMVPLHIRNALIVVEMGLGEDKLHRGQAGGS